MVRSNDFEKIRENYQEVFKTKNLSIEDYCQRNGIVYSLFPPMVHLEFLIKEQL